jgi:hypothetical protein
MVEEVFINHARLWHLHVDGQIIRTTREHPFWVRSKGWRCVDEMQAGDMLRSDNGQWVAVEDICDSGVDEKVYNVRIAEHHTYFVGDLNTWRFSAWAHNVNRCGGEVAKDLLEQNGMHETETPPGSRPGSNGWADHEAGVREAARYAEGLARPGETVHVQERVNVRGSKSRRIPDVQIQDASGNTRYVIEVERRPNGKYHLERLLEYQKLGIPVETWKL